MEDQISDVNDKNNDKNEPVTETKIKKTRQRDNTVLKAFHSDDIDILEIGVDEAGRGPLFGRVYSAAVVLPKDNSFDHFKMKDSKRFHSKKQIEETANYIKENAVAWYVSFEDEKTVDQINILQATQKAMHSAILETRDQCKKKTCHARFHLLIDGNYFNPLTVFNKEANKIEIVLRISLYNL